MQKGPSITAHMEGHPQPQNGMPFSVLVLRATFKFSIWESGIKGDARGHLGGPFLRAVGKPIVGPKPVFSPLDDVPFAVALHKLVRKSCYGSRVVADDEHPQGENRLSRDQ